MKLFKVFFSVVLSSILLLQGCAYHGKVRRGLYNFEDLEEKIPLKVMVVADQFLPHSLSYPEKSFYYDFDINISLDDGISVLTADALGTLFGEVEVNTYNLRKNYDLIAEVTFDFTNEKYVGIRWFEKMDTDTIDYNLYIKSWFMTQVNVTLRNPHTGYALAQYSSHRKTYIPQTFQRNLAQTLDMVTLSLLSPYNVFVRGRQFRKLLEKNLVLRLDNIMEQMNEDREIFMDLEKQEELTKRYDGQYTLWMKKTVRIDAAKSLGSGFFISPKGYIVTNAHVVDDARDVRVTLYTDPLYTNDEEKKQVRYGRVLKKNKSRDLALVKIEGDNYPFFEMDTDLRNYITGEPVIAIGAPQGLNWTLTKGVISKTAVSSDSTVHQIQTDTPINPGNSGGPLISLNTGKAVGVNSSVLSPLRPLDVVNSLGFAISSYEAARTLGVKQPIEDEDWESLLLQ